MISVTSSSGVFSTSVISVTSSSGVDSTSVIFETSSSGVFSTSVISVTSSYFEKTPEELVTEITDFETTPEEIVTEITDVEKTREELVTEITDVEQSPEELVTEITDVEKTREELVTEITDVEKSPEELVTEITDVETKPEELVTEITDVETTPEELVTEITHVEKTPEELFTEITHVDTAPEELVTEITGVDTTPEELVTEITDVETTPEELVTEITDVETTTDELVTEITDVDTTPEELVTEITDVEKTPEELVIEITDVESTPEEVVAEITDVEKTPEDLVTEITDVEKTPKELVTEITDVDTKPEELVTEITDVDTKPEELVTEITDVETTPEELVTEIKDIETEGTDTEDMEHRETSPDYVGTEIIKDEDLVSDVVFSDATHEPLMPEDAPVCETTCEELIEITADLVSENEEHESELYTKSEQGIDHREEFLKEAGKYAIEVTYSDSSDYDEVAGSKHSEDSIFPGSGKSTRPAGSKTSDASTQFDVPLSDPVSDEVVVTEISDFETVPKEVKHELTTDVGVGTGSEHLESETTTDEDTVRKVEHLHTEIAEDAVEYFEHEISVGIGDTEPCSKEEFVTDVCGHEIDHREEFTSELEKVEFEEHVLQHENVDVTSEYEETEIANDLGDDTSHEECQIEMTDTEDDIAKAKDLEAKIIPIVMTDSFDDTETSLTQESVRDVCDHKTPEQTIDHREEYIHELEKVDFEDQVLQHEHIDVTSEYLETEIATHVTAYTEHEAFHAELTDIEDDTKAGDMNDQIIYDGMEKITDSFGDTETSLREWSAADVSEHESKAEQTIDHKEEFISDLEKVDYKEEQVLEYEHADVKPEDAETEDVADTEREQFETEMTVSEDHSAKAGVLEDNILHDDVPELSQSLGDTVTSLTQESVRDVHDHKTPEQTIDHREEFITDLQKDEYEEQLLEYEHAGVKPEYTETEITQDIVADTGLEQFETEKTFSEDHSAKAGVLEDNILHDDVAELSQSLGDTVTSLTQESVRDVHDHKTAEHTIDHREEFITDLQKVDYEEQLLEYEHADVKPEYTETEITQDIVADTGLEQSQTEKTVSEDDSAKAGVLEDMILHDAIPEMTDRFCDTETSLTEERIVGVDDHEIMESEQTIDHKEEFINELKKSEFEGHVSAHQSADITPEECITAVEQIDDKTTSHADADTGVHEDVDTSSMEGFVSDATAETDETRDHKEESIKEVEKTVVEDQVCDTIIDDADNKPQQVETGIIQESNTEHEVVQTEITNTEEGATTAEELVSVITETIEQTEISFLEELEIKEREQSIDHMEKFISELEESVIGDKQTLPDLPEPVETRDTDKGEPVETRDTDKGEQVETRDTDKGTVDLHMDSDIAHTENVITAVGHLHTETVVPHDREADVTEESVASVTAEYVTDDDDLIPKNTEHMIDHKEYFIKGLEKYIADDQTTEAKPDADMDISEYLERSAVTDDQMGETQTHMENIDNTLDVQTTDIITSSKDSEVRQIENAVEQTEDTAKHDMDVTSETLTEESKADDMEEEMHESDGQWLIASYNPETGDMDYSYGSVDSIMKQSPFARSCVEESVTSSEGKPLEHEPETRPQSQMKEELEDVTPVDEPNYSDLVEWLTGVQQASQESVPDRDVTQPSDSDNLSNQMFESKSSYDEVFQELLDFDQAVESSADTESYSKTDSESAIDHKEEHLQEEHRHSLPGDSTSGDSVTPYDVHRDTYSTAAYDRDIIPSEDKTAEEITKSTSVDGAGENTEGTSNELQENIFDAFEPRIDSSKDFNLESQPTCYIEDTEEYYDQHIYSKLDHPTDVHTIPTDSSEMDSAHQTKQAKQADESVDNKVTTDVEDQTEMISHEKVVTVVEDQTEMTSDENIVTDVEDQTQMHSYENVITVVEDQIEITSDENVVKDVEDQTEMTSYENVTTDVKDQTEMSPDEKVITDIEDQTELTSNENVITGVEDQTEMSSDEKVITDVEDQTEMTSDEKVITDVEDQTEMTSDDNDVTDVEDQTEMTSDENVVTDVEDQREITSDENVVTDVEDQREMTSDEKVITDVEDQTEPTSDENVITDVENQTEMTSDEKVITGVEDQTETTSDEKGITNVEDQTEMTSDENVSTGFEDQTEMTSDEKDVTDVEDQTEMTSYENVTTDVKDQTEMSPDEKVITDIEDQTELTSNENVITGVEDQTEMSSDEKVITDVEDQTEMTSDEKVITDVEDQTEMTSDDKDVTDVEDQTEMTSDENVVTEVEDQREITSDENVVTDVEDQREMTSDEKVITDVEDQTEPTSDENVITDVENQTEMTSDEKVITGVEDQTETTSDEKGITNVEDQTEMTSDENISTGFEDQTEMTSDEKVITGVEDQTEMTSDEKGITNVEEQTEMTSDENVSTGVEDQTEMISDEKVITDVEDQTEITSDENVVTDVEEQTEMPSRENIVTDVEDKTEMTSDEKDVTDVEDQTEMTSDEKVVTDVENQTEMTSDVKVITNFEDQTEMTSDDNDVTDVEDQTEMTSDENVVTDVEDQREITSDENVVTNVEDQTEMTSDENVSTGFEDQTEMTSDEKDVTDVGHQTEMISHEKVVTVIEDQTDMTSDENIVTDVEDQTQIHSYENVITVVEDQIEITSDENVVKDVEDQTEMTSYENVTTDVKDQTEMSPDEKVITDIEDQTELTSNENVITGVEDQTEMSSDEKVITDVEDQTEMTSDEKVITDVEDQTEMTSDDNDVTDVEDQTEMTSDENVVTDVEDQREITSDENVVTDVEDQREMTSDEKVAIDFGDQTEIYSDEKVVTDVKEQTKISVDENVEDRTETSTSSDEKLISDVEEHTDIENMATATDDSVETTADEKITLDVDILDIESQILISPEDIVSDFDEGQIKTSKDREIITVIEEYEPVTVTQAELSEEQSAVHTPTDETNQTLIKIPSIYAFESQESESVSTTEAEYLVAEADEADIQRPVFYIPGVDDDEGEDKEVTLGTDFEMESRVIPEQQTTTSPASASTPADSVVLPEALDVTVKAVEPVSYARGARDNEDKVITDSDSELDSKMIPVEAAAASAVSVSSPSDSDGIPEVLKITMESIETAPLSHLGIVEASSEAFSQQPQSDIPTSTETVPEQTQSDKEKHQIGVEGDTSRQSGSRQSSVPASDYSETVSDSLDAQYEVVVVDDTDEDVKGESEFDELIDEDWVFTTSQHEDKTEGKLEHKSEHSFAPPVTKGESVERTDEELKLTDSKTFVESSDKTAEESESSTESRRPRIPSVYQRTMSATLSCVTEIVDWTQEIGELDDAFDDELFTGADDKSPSPTQQKLARFPSFPSRTMSGSLSELKEEWHEDTGHIEEIGKAEVCISEVGVPLQLKSEPDEEQESVFKTDVDEDSVSTDTVSLRNPYAALCSDSTDTASEGDSLTGKIFTFNASQEQCTQQTTKPSLHRQPNVVLDSEPSKDDDTESTKAQTLTGDQQQSVTKGKKKKRKSRKPQSDTTALPQVPGTEVGEPVSSEGLTEISMDVKAPASRQPEFVPSEDKEEIVDSSAAEPAIEERDSQCKLDCSELSVAVGSAKRKTKKKATPQESKTRETELKEADTKIIESK